MNDGSCGELPLKRCARTGAVVTLWADPFGFVLDVMTGRGIGVGDKESGHQISSFFDMEGAV